MSEDRRGYVYLLKAHKPFHEVYKIGCSAQVGRRLKTFAVRLPFKVELLACTKYTRMYEAERRWHEVFEHRRVDGEWFALTPEEVEFMRAALLGIEAITLVARLEAVQPKYGEEEATTYFLRLGRWARVLARAVSRYERRNARHFQLRRAVNIPPSR